MAKEKLFKPKPTDSDDKREPHDRFTDLAKQVVNVPKDEIDEREKEWQRQKSKR